jgi:hypothetical protein
MPSLPDDRPPRLGCYMPISSFMPPSETQLHELRCCPSPTNLLLACPAFTLANYPASSTGRPSGESVFLAILPLCTLNFSTSRRSRVLSPPPMYYRDTAVTDIFSQLQTYSRSYRHILAVTLGILQLHSVPESEALSRSRYSRSSLLARRSTEPLHLYL